MAGFVLKADQPKPHSIQFHSIQSLFWALHASGLNQNTIATCSLLHNGNRMPINSRSPLLTLPVHASGIENLKI